MADEALWLTMFGVEPRARLIGLEVAGAVHGMPSLSEMIPITSTLAIGDEASVILVSQASRWDSRRV